MFLFMFLFFIVRALAVTKSMNFSVKLHHTVMPWILKPLIKFGEDSVDLLMLKSGRRSNSAKKRATGSSVIKKILKGLDIKWTFLVNKLQIFNRMK